MAEGNTTISAIFAGDDTYEAQTVTYTLTVEAAQPVTYSFTINISNEADPINVGSYAEGEEVTYTFDSAYADDPGVSRWAQSITPSDLVYEFDPGSVNYDEELQEEVVTNASISFTMPAADVTFTITQITLYEVNVNDILNGSYPEGENVTIVTGGTLASISPNDLEYTFDSGTMECSFTMPAQSVNIYTVPKITWVDDYSELVNDANITEAAVGTDLLFTALSGVDLYNDYDCSVVEDVSGDAVQLYAPTSETNGIGFIMPDADVIITIEPKQP